MAFGLSVWVFLLFVQGYFASNNVSSTAQLSSSATIVSALSSPTATFSLFDVSLTSQSLLSAARISKSKETFHCTTTEMALTKSTLFPTPQSGNTLVSSSPAMHGLQSKTQTFTGSPSAVNPSLASNVSTPMKLNSTSTTEPTTSPPTRESLLSGQLAGVGLILFILVVLLLIICLGNFADEPVFNERELFTEEISMKNLGKDADSQGQQEDEEWKFDPLFAWSPRKSFDSKL